MTSHQLTQNLKDILSGLVQIVREKQIPEEFDVVWGVDGAAFHVPGKGFLKIENLRLRNIHLEALESAGLLYTRPVLHNGREIRRTCFVTPTGNRLVDDNFVVTQPAADVAHPVEITDSLKNFTQDHPKYAANCFLMMRFGNTELHSRLVTALRVALEPYDISVLRADDKEYHEDIYFNILTYIYGCSFGVAVFERIEQDDFNPNVALEVGLMFGLKKKVCLLKDNTLKSLHTDLVGKLYKTFDTIQPDADIRKHLKAWLSDKGIITIPNAS